MKGYCEAMVEYGGRYRPCGHPAEDLHHRLTRSRGGKILDKAGETYHLMRLCHEHHMEAHRLGTSSNGMLIKGLVITCKLCKTPYYEGPDDWLTEHYGAKTHEYNHMDV